MDECYYSSVQTWRRRRTMAKSYFAVLGVTSSASPDEIRSAYRRLAKEFHPDHFEGGSERFLQIQEAYSVLADKDKRKKYEESLFKPLEKRPDVRRSRTVPEPLTPEKRPVGRDETSLCGSFTTFAPSLGRFIDDWPNTVFRFGRPDASRLRNLTLEVPLSTEQTSRGGRTRITIPVHRVCPVCDGYRGFGFFACRRCAGDGSISGEVALSVAYPARITRDHAVVIPLGGFGLGNAQLTVLFRLMDDSCF
jgi:DnaJ-class molecular chaperone